MSQLTLEEIVNLMGIYDLELTKPQRKFLVKSTQRLVKRKGLDWLKNYKSLLRDQLDTVFKEISVNPRLSNKMETKPVSKDSKKDK